MPIDDPNTWAHGAAAFKSIFDGLRSAIGMLRDLRGSGGTPARESELIDAALDKAEKATAIAEAEVAKALGYQLCKCEFPPIPMRTIGHISNALAKQNGIQGPVYECPKCGFNSALSFSYARIAPPRGGNRGLPLPNFGDKLFHTHDPQWPALGLSR